MNPNGRTPPVSNGEALRVHGTPAELRTRLIQAAYEAAVAEGRYEAPLARRAASRARLYRDGRLTLLAPYFDYAFYADACPDFAASALDELEHYNFFGWRQSLNPTAWFDTAYYLAANADVRAAGDNPFWHYIFKGRAEGRTSQRPRHAERMILERTRSPEAPEAAAPDPTPLGADELAARRVAALPGAQGFLYAVGARPPCAPTGWLCLQAAPLRAAATLTAMPAAWAQTRLILDGEPLGVAMDAEIAKAIVALREALPAERALVVNDAAGCSVEGLLSIEAALEPGRREFHLGDFASICPSARLLRNDVAFCGAPPPGSPACGICSYGEARKAQLAAMQRLFQRCRFAVVAPSEPALALWRAASDLPHESAEAMAPTRLEPLPDPAEDDLVGEAQPVRVAYLGAPTLAEGWPTYERLLEACGDLAAYAFHHFGHAAELKPRGQLFSVETAPDDATSLRAKLIERRIDLVVMAREGPQTHSPEAIEALTAGCDLVALAHSGHAAWLAQAERRGRAFETDEDVVAFFVEGRAIAYMRERERFPRPLARVRRDRDDGEAT